MLGYQDQALRVRQPVGEALGFLVIGGRVAELGEECGDLVCVAGFGLADGKVGIPGHGVLVCPSSAQVPNPCEWVPGLRSAKSVAGDARRRPRRGTQERDTRARGNAA